MNFGEAMRVAREEKMMERYEMEQEMSCMKMHIDDLTKERDNWKRKAELPMKYKRMTFNAKVSGERSESDGLTG